MIRLLLGTSSQKKIAELHEILAGVPADLVDPLSIGLSLDPEETGETFEDNAILKARTFASASGLPALADDSGLEVDALGGGPGVHSKRYAGPGATDGDRIALLLKNLAAVPDSQRTARFRCVIALATPAGLIGTVDGTCEGRIAHAPRGTNGFGYDPVFLLPERGKTIAELESGQKHQISHRGRAGAAARDLIARWVHAQSPAAGAAAPARR
ncbi:MAG TPA: RdgB/HAM1 family non-canonical purine NTP pyrophosphatase [Chloroflexota bacterium]|nr:RdgB/HAM1 family non-canonical purine NTP pyrophosphatase [Chloroflexota bacterium]